MSLDLSVALDQLQEITTDLIRSLPNLLIALFIIALFFVVARSVRTLVRRISKKREEHSNVGRVLERMAQWATLLLGALVERAGT
jgi:RecA/RadA recombinase